MDFRYDNMGQITKSTIKAGQKWDSKNNNNEHFNNIFKDLDDGDNVVSQLELDTYNRIFKSRDFNKDGKLHYYEATKTYTKEELQQLKSSVNIASNIHKDINKMNFIFPTTGKNFEKHVKEINADNVSDVLEAYKDKTNGKESLFTGIMDERGLNINTRLDCIKHVFTSLQDNCQKKGIYSGDLTQSFEKELEKQRNSKNPNAKNIDRMVEQLLTRTPERPNTDKENIAPNGKIDGDFKQGPMNDCWLLSSIKAISETQKGSEILNNSIKVNDDGSVTVNLKGPDKTYTYSKEDLSRNSHLSTGDMDVRALEMAVNTFVTEEGALSSNKEVDINYNNPYYAYEILTGKTVDHFFPLGSSSDIMFHPERYGKAPITDKMIDDFNKPNHVAVVYASKDKNTENPKIKISDDNTISLSKAHAYSVVRSDEKYVYITNPYDSKTEIPVERKTFTEFFDRLHEFDL